MPNAPEPEPVLTQEERDALVVEHLDLVGQVVAEVAARYPRHVDRSELWNAGALGLVEASRRFDPTAGSPFGRYASIRVRGAIIDSTRTRDWASRSVRRRLREVNDARAELEGRLGRSPAAEELARHLGITTDELHRRISGAAQGTVLHLDQPFAGEDEDEEAGSLADQLAERRPEMSPQDAIEQRELSGTLAEAIRHLPDPQAEVVTRSYLRGERLADIADEMGLTEARVSQIRSEALVALRSFFSTQYEGIEEVDQAAPGKRARVAYLEEMASVKWRRRLDAAEELTG